MRALSYLFEIGIKLVAWVNESPYLTDCNF